ncbi:MAG: hypothetical protein ACR2LK_05265 [Solirubrobacteraceae bacterium]
MPTQRKRHTVTETDAVGDTLRQVEAVTGRRADLGELIVIGGEVKLRRAEQDARDSQARLRLRQRFVERTQTGEGIDTGALQAVHESGWMDE